MKTKGLVADSGRPFREISFNQLRAISDQLDKVRCPIGTVETIEEANKLTEQDMTGHKWKVGERFYTTTTANK